MRIPRATAGRPWWALLVMLSGCLIVLAWWVARGQAVLSPQPATQLPQRLPCVSYSPFRHPNINPFNFLAKVTPAQIEADLVILKTRTDCIRTYGLTQGLDAVPAVAKKVGMRVKLGVWLTRDPIENQQQLNQGLTLAKRYPDVIDMLVVGNEVLLRRELTVTQLGEILRLAKAQSTVPVTYADVWEFWQRNSVLAKDVDIVTIHILPYWEDKPVTVDKAAKHVHDIAREMQQYFPGKPLWIGETGWPAAGRQRDGAIPGRVEQTLFIRDLLLLGSSIAQEFNVIEAFDQPWKRAFEGAMGGYWGLFDAQGLERVRFSGSIVEDSKWWHGLVGAGLGALLGCLGALVGLRYLSAQGTGRVFRQRLQFVLTGLLVGALVGASIAVQILMTVWWDRTPFESALSMGLGIAGAFAAVLGAGQLALADHVWPASKPSLRFFVAAAQASRGIVLFTAASAALILLLDPRYRPFPWWWFLAPTVCWFALRLGAPQAIKDGARQVQFLASVLAIFTLAMMVQEGWRNAQALCYGALLLTLAGVAIWPAEAKTKAASNAAGALNSVE